MNNSIANKLAKSVRHSKEQQTMQQADTTTPAPEPTHESPKERNTQREHIHFLPARRCWPD